MITEGNNLQLNFIMHIIVSCGVVIRLYIHSVVAMEWAKNDTLGRYLILSRFTTG